VPKILDDCVQSVLNGWREKPKSAPKRNKSGKPVKTEQDRRSVATAMCTSSLQKAGKMEYDDDEYYFSEDVDSANPAMTGLAFTNKPYIQGLEEMSFVDGNGEPWAENAGAKLLKIPLLLLGKWKHRRGILNFTSGFVSKMIENFASGVVGNKISADARHMPGVSGALAWVSKLFQETRMDGKEQVSVIAAPTTTGQQLVEEQRFRYGSIEFVPNFKRRQIVEALSMDGIQGPYVELESCPIDQSEFEDLFEEATTMPEDQDQVSLDDFNTLKDQVTQLTAALTAEQATVRGLRVRTAKQFVEGLIMKAEAYRDGDGRGHSKVFLDWMNSILLCQPVGEGDESISLENKNEVADVHAYYRRGIAWLANNVPGAGPSLNPPVTQPDKDRPVNDLSVELELDEDDMRELDDVWAMAAA
jgi:hypothetical protein